MHIFSCLCMHEFFNSSTLRHTSSSTKQQTSNSSHTAAIEIIIPNDVIYEILANLPVKSLIRFKCLCKPWNALISTPQFAKYHLHSSPTHNRLILIPPHNYRLSRDLLDYSITSMFRCSYFTGAKPTCRARPYDVIYTNDPSIIGSCHGIIVITNPGTLPLLWNPCTGESKKMPHLENPQDLTFQSYSFGYDVISDTYKMVSLHSIDTGYEKVFTKVHALGTGSWRDIHYFPARPSYGHHIGKYLNGTLNWLATSYKCPDNTYSGPHVLVSLDLGTEEYQQLLLPPVSLSYDASFRSTNLGVSKGCLCVVVGYSFGTDVWVMKDYGNDGSWTKLMVVPYLGDYPQIRGYQTNSIGRVVCVSDDDEVLLELQHQKKLIVYNSKTRTIRTAGNQNFRGDICSEVYAESLISPCF